MPLIATRRAGAQAILLLVLAGCGRADQAARSQPPATAIPPTRRIQPTFTPRPTRAAQPTFTPTATVTPVPPASPAADPFAQPTFTPIPTPALDAAQQQIIGYWMYVDPESKRSSSFVFSPNGSTGWFMTHESGYLGTFRFTGPDQLETDMADVDRDYRFYAWTVRFSPDGEQLTVASNTGETAPFQLTRINDPAMPMPPEGFPGYGRPAPTPTPVVAALPAAVLEPYAEPSGLFRIGVAAGWRLKEPRVRRMHATAAEQWLEYQWEPEQTHKLSRQFVYVVNVQDGVNHRWAMQTLLNAYYAGQTDYREKKNFDMADLQMRTVLYRAADGTEVQAELIGSLEPPYFVVYGYHMPASTGPAAKGFGKQVIDSFAFDPTVKMAELGIR